MLEMRDVCIETVFSRIDVLPKFWNNIVAINDNMVSDTTSPIEAAKGVARLSGFRLNLKDNNITATNTKSGMKKKENNCTKISSFVTTTAQFST